MPLILEIETLNLGAEVRAIGMELVEPDATREPVRGAHAARIWSSIIPAIAEDGPLCFDFFSHLDRVREYCEAHKLNWREGVGDCVVILAPKANELANLFERFERETFGGRAGELVKRGDTRLEEELARRGADAYQAAYSNYTFCAIFSLEDASVTLLAPRLWASEAVRRARAAVDADEVEIRQPD